jgi:hypothetical protein
LDPRDNFSKFDIDKIARLTEIYDEDISIVDCSNINDRLELLLLHVQRVEEFNVCTDL